MRNRNKEFSKNIGDLLDEINNQDLENINGGQDINVGPGINSHSCLLYISCGCPSTRDDVCLELMFPMYTKLSNCK